jgi:hypothetical protein
MPDGKDGKIPIGLDQILCSESQKHLGQSRIKFIAEGDSLKDVMAWDRNKNLNSLLNLFFYG